MKTTETCSEAYKSMSDQLAKHSPEARKDLTPAEHQTAQKLAADVHDMFQPMGKSALQWLNQYDKANNDAANLIDGVKDKSRLDGILADANKLLSKDDQKLLKSTEGPVIVGQKEAGGWAPSPIGKLDCEPTKDEFQIIDRYNRNRELENLKN